MRLFLIAISLLFLLMPAAQAEEARADWRFGLIESYEAPELAAEAGAGWTRVVIHWAEVQADGPETWTPRVSDAQIDGELAAGRMVVGLLIGIPDWARDERRLPAGLDLPHDDAGNLWTTFVRQVVTHYRGRINHWIIWNEPDIDGGHARAWEGSLEEFALLHRAAYLTIKETAPEASVHLAATTYFWDEQHGREQYLGRLLAQLSQMPDAAEHNYYFDALTAHLYFQPNRIYDIIQEFQEMRAAQGIPYKPLWLVETNAPPMDDPAWPVPNWTLAVTIYEQAAFIPQGIAAALAAGAERVAVYKLQELPGDREANPEPFGLVRLNGSRRPAFTAYQVAVEYMAGMVQAERERWNEVGQIRIDQTDRTTTVLFARLPFPQQAQVAASAETAWLVDMWGERQEIGAADGFFTVDLPAALCSQSIGDYCMIGGTTYYLVQARDGGPPPEERPPQVDPTPTPTPTPTATTTPLPTPTTAPTATPTPTLSYTPTPMHSYTPTPMRSYTPTPMHSSTPTPMHSSTPTLTQETPIEPSPLLSYLFISAGLLLALLLVGWRLYSRGDG